MHLDATWFHRWFQRQSHAEHLPPAGSRAGAAAVRIGAGPPGEREPAPRPSIPLSVGHAHTGLHVRGFASCPVCLLPHGGRGLKTFPASEAKMLCDQDVPRLHLIPSCGFRLRVSDFLSPPLCPQALPALPHLLMECSQK